MVMKTPARKIAVALLVGVASFAAPAAAHNAPTPPRHAKMPSSYDKKLFMSGVAEYNAGLRRGRSYSTNSAYLRGFRDGTSTVAYSSRAYVVDSYGGNPVASDPADASYLRDAGYDTGTGGYSPYSGYSPYNGHSGSYDAINGYAFDRYNAGSAPRGLINVAVAPFSATPSLEARSAHWSYCAARYQSFDPGSNTFLANDGNRYYCR
jgi:BA14K-like protein